MITMESSKSDESLRAVFRTYDKDNNGEIDMTELKAVLRAGYIALGMPVDEKKVIQRAKVRIMQPLAAPEIVN